MPVYKFKSFEEAEQALWNFSPDDRYFHRLRNLFHLAAHFRPISWRKGVRKYRNIEEANQDSNPIPE